MIAESTTGEMTVEIRIVADARSTNCLYCCASTKHKAAVGNAARMTAAPRQ